MTLCPTCKASFHGDEQFCPRDGTPLRTSLPEDPLAGRVLSGRYRLIEILGRGGMGAVYRAHHILMDKAVAVKVLRQELASDTEAVARFHREARSASRLDHDYIIRVSDFGQTDDGLLFLVMELLDGENLAQVLRRGALPWRRAAAVARDVALGLSHAHEQGVIHRDLKPENIVLIRRGKSRQLVKVLDFGLAKLVHHARPGNATGGETDGSGADDVPDVAVQSLTRSGVVFGTPEYMSPEQAEGRVLDTRTDIYALGVVTYQMLCGKLPFSAPTFLALIAKTVNEPPPPLRLPGEPPLDLPPQLEDLVMRCLSKSPDERPQNTEEIAEELDQLLARFPEEPSRSGEVQTVAPPTGPKKPDSGAMIAGGVARTVQRQLPPGQIPRTAPRDSNPRGFGEPAAAAEISGRSRKIDAPASAVVSGESPTVPPPAAEDASSESAERPLDEAPARSVASSPAASGRRELEPREQSAERPELPASNTSFQEQPLKVPRRPYWLAAIGGVLILVGGIYIASPASLGRSQPPVVETEREPLRRARELLAQQPLGPTQIDEALQILRDEREAHNTPEVHRLLSRAYEAQNNRLRALGHLYAALRMPGSSLETARSQLALSQLLSRLGQPHDACSVATQLLGQGRLNDKDLRRQAEALSDTLRCPATASVSGARP